MKKCQLGRIGAGKLNNFPKYYPRPLFKFLHIILTGAHKVVYWKNQKSKKLILFFIFFPVLMAIYSFKCPCAITLILRNTPIIFLLVSIHGFFFHIFHIHNNRLLGDPFCKLSYCVLARISTIIISVGFSIPLDMDLFAAFLTSHIWPGR